MASKNPLNTEIQCIAKPTINGCLGLMSGLGICTECSDNNYLKLSWNNGGLPRFGCPVYCEEKQYLDEQDACQNCSENCLECAANTGFCSYCQQGFIEVADSKQCAVQADVLELWDVYFDDHLFTLTAYFSEDILLINKQNLMVILSHQDTSKIIKITSVKGSGNQLVFELDFQETEGFRGQDIQITNESLDIISTSQMEQYLKKEPLSRADNISKLSSQSVSFSEYPIHVNDISTFIPKKDSKSLASALGNSQDIASDVAKPAILILMIVSMPTALGLQKTIQYVEYLQFFNVDNQQRNILDTIAYTSYTNILTNLNFFGDVLKIQEKGKEAVKEETTTQSKRPVPKKPNIKKRVLNEDNNEESKEHEQGCKTHRLFEKKGYECQVWNQMRTTIFMILALAAITIFIKLVDKCCAKKLAKNKIRAQNGNQQAQQNGHSRITGVNEDNNQAKKKGCIAKMGIFLSEFFDLNFFVNFCYGVKLNVLLISSIGLQNARIESLWGIISLVVSILVVLFYAALTAIVLIKTRLFYKKSKIDEKNKKWAFLIEDLKPKVKLAPYIVSFSWLKDFFSPMILVLSVNNLLGQLIPIIILNFFMALFLVVKRPYKSCLDNVANFITAANFLICNTSANRA